MAERASGRWTSFFRRQDIEEEDLWGLCHKSLGEIEESQLKARRNPDALSKVVSTIRIFKSGGWMTSREFQNELP